MRRNRLKNRENNQAPLYTDNMLGSSKNARAFYNLITN